MPRVKRPPSQEWKTFLHNHADGIAAMDFFVVPTISFRLLFGLLIPRHDRREILWFGATEHPTAEWIARQLTEAFGWETPPRYLVRDRDRALWRRVRPACSGNGHSGSTHRGAVTMAERILRKGERLDSTGLP
jgi:hypothetical protein